MAARNHILATGRRKEAVARVRLFPGGTGKMTVNGLPVDQYFKLETHIMVCQQALVHTSTLAKFDVEVNVRGGGISGQAGAIRHGVSRTLVKFDEELRRPLREEGFMTRDARMKERKKFGQRGARARFQFSKR